MRCYSILDGILTLEKKPTEQNIWSSMEEKGNKGTKPWRLRKGKKDQVEWTNALCSAFRVPCALSEMGTRHESCKFLSVCSGNVIFPVFAEQREIDAVEQFR